MPAQPTVFKALLLAVLVSPSLAAAQTGPVDHGRFGKWFASAPRGMKLEEEEGSDRFLQNFSRLSLPSRESLFRTYRSVQVNVDRNGLNIVGDAANEPSMAMDPNNRNRLTVGWRQFDNVASNFRQAGNGYSINGGSSWINNTVFTPGQFRSDPVLDADAEGRFYYNSLQGTFFDDVFRSLDGGANWALQGPATGGDKQWMTIDKTSSPGHGHLYQCWSTAGNNYQGRQFSRSTDGGFRWMDPINIPSSPIWGTLDVAKNGDLYLCGLSNPFSFVRSSNAKIKGGTPSFDMVVPVNLGGSIVFGSFLSPAGLTGQAWIATDRSSRKTSGNIYMLCSVGVDPKNPCQVNFVRRTNGRRNWSAPRTNNTDRRGLSAWHWFGAMSVAPNGRIDVCWLDNRANPTLPISALYTSSSFNGGLSWTPNVRISRAFDSTIGFPNQDKIGDYLAIVSDNHGANIVYPATFNGEQDIWYVRVPVIPGNPHNAIAASTYEGLSNGGSAGSLWKVDGNAYSISSAYLKDLGQGAAVLAQYGVDDSPSTLALHLTATSSTLTTGMAWVYNVKTKLYDWLKSFPMPAGTAVDLNLPVTGDASNYIAADGKVKVILRALAPKRNIRPFLLKVELLQLLSG